MKKARTVKISKLFVLVVVFLFVIIIGKLSYVVLSKEVDGVDLTAFASKRNTKKEIITAERGIIYDSLGNALALDVNSYTVIAILSSSRTTDPNNPQHVVDKERTAKELSPLINMTEESIMNLLNTENVYQVELGPGGRGITELLKETIDELNLPGIIFDKSIKRYYPNRDFLSYTLGYAKKDDTGSMVGEMGIELAFNKDLTGIDGFREYESDIYGYRIVNTLENVQEAESGKDIYLTIDTNIQMFTEQAISKLETASSLEWATISVVNAKTGEILGVASSPSFDPNIKDIVNYYDPFVSYAYEPGSTMKIFSFMLAIENGIYNGEEMYMSGTIDIGENTIKDWNDYGWGSITFDQGFYGSSNVAATILSQRLGGQALRDFYNKLGYGKKTKITLPNEQKGSINFQYDVEVANASFGQGMSVTPVQMIQALTSIANDGTTVRPYIVSKVVDKKTGKVIVENKRTEVTKVASAETIKKVKDLMWGVVNSDEKTASGKAYRTNGVTTIGKTGTAQIASNNGGYLTGSINYLRSFAGLFPYEDPEIIVYVVASKISAPSLISEATKSLIEDVSTYLGISGNIDQKIEETHIVESYINKKVPTLKETLNNKGLSPIIIGNGDKVIKQYPNKSTILNTNDKLLLLTNGNEIKYENIEGWSKSDLIEYSKLLNVTFNFTGYGYAVNTNLSGNIVNPGETIEITLEPKYTKADPSSTTNDT